MDEVEGLFEKCPECDSINLAGTSFYYDKYACTWTRVKCVCKYLCCCTHPIDNFDTTAEDVLEQVPIEVQDKLLFHLDVFSKSSPQKSRVHAEKKMMSHPEKKRSRGLIWR